MFVLVHVLADRCILMLTSEDPTPCMQLGHFNLLACPSFIHSFACLKQIPTIFFNDYVLMPLLVFLVF